MAKTENGRRLRWTDAELDNFYRAAITERRSVEYMMKHSSNGRTEKAIHSKLWKTFAIAQRSTENETFYYLSEDAPTAVIKRRPKVDNTKYLKATLQEMYVQIGEMEYLLRDAKDHAHRLKQQLV